MSKKKTAHSPAIPPESLHMPPSGIDSHAHLDLRYFSQDLDEVLARAKRSGISHIGNVFLSVAAWEKGRELFARHSDVFFLLGVHPTEGEQCTPQALEAMRAAFCSDPKLKAVGETGLDYYWKVCPRSVQHDAFIAQLALAKDLGKPVVVHSRNAFQETLDLLLEQGFSHYPVLWHCFGGNADQAKRLVMEDWYISIPGPVSFPANHTLREALCHIPLDRLVAETDCPYLTPIPYRGKRNEPAYAAFTVQTMAETLGMDPAELWTICGDTARKFFEL